VALRAAGCNFNEFKLGGLHEKHAVGKRNLGTTSAFAQKQRKTKRTYVDVVGGRTFPVGIICKQLSVLINLTIKLYNTTYYLHTTDNTHAAKGMEREQIRNERYSRKSLLNEWTTTTMKNINTLINFNSRLIYF
jgi:uncharacterized membrane protein